MVQLYITKIDWINNDNYYTYFVFRIRSLSYFNQTLSTLPNVFVIYIWFSDGINIMDFWEICFQSLITSCAFFSLLYKTNSSCFIFFILSVWICLFFVCLQFQRCGSMFYTSNSVQSNVT